MSGLTNAFNDYVATTDQKPEGAVSQTRIFVLWISPHTAESAPEMKGFGRVSQLVALMKPAIGTAGSAMHRAPKEAHFPCRT